MKRTKIKYFIAFVLLSGGLFGGLSPEDTFAQSKSTPVTVTFQEAPAPQPPISNGNTDLPNTQSIIEKSSSFGGYSPSVSTKRLPVTGEEYSQALLGLGWLSVLFALLCFLAGNRRKGEDNASN